MISGAFHTMSQEWRYFSREKSIVHTLHLAQLPGSNRGDTVEIASTASQINNGLGGLPRFTVPPLQLPGAPTISATVFNNYSQFVGSSCYGCVTPNKIISAEKNCAITIDSWSNALMQVTMNVGAGFQNGKFLIHIECQTDMRTLGYQGPGNDGLCVGSITVDGVGVGTANMQVLMVGTVWNSNLYINSVGHASETLIAKVGSTVVFQGTNLGDPAGTPAAHISCFILRVDAP